MRTVLVHKIDLELLFHSFKDSPRDREFFLADGLVQYFDTALGKFKATEFLKCLPDDYAELLSLIMNWDESEIQALADMGKLPPPFSDKYPASIPPRYVEVPALDWETERTWRNEAAEGSYNGQGPRRIILEEIKAKRVPDLIIDWIEKIGRERGIRYQFQIQLLGP